MVPQTILLLRMDCIKMAYNPDIGDLLEEFDSVDPSRSDAGEHEDSDESKDDEEYRQQEEQSSSEEKPHLDQEPDAHEDPNTDKTSTESKTIPNVKVSVFCMRSMSYLREASQIIWLDTEAINNVAACFSSWMESDNSPFEICVNANGQKMFNFLQVRLGEYDQGWKMISDIGLRLRACACSEASCERTISAQRLLLTCHNLRSRDETIAARLKIIKGCE